MIANKVRSSYRVRYKGKQNKICKLCHEDNFRNSKPIQTKLGQCMTLYVFSVNFLIKYVTLIIRLQSQKIFRGIH